MSDFLGEKCGIFGIFGNNMDVSRLTYYGLFALQHRGQESSGIATSNGWRIDVFKNKGLVTHAYSEENIQALKGHIAIGHNRYSTSEGTGLLHAQPALSRSGDLALAHNGNLPSVVKLQKFLQSKKILTENRTDSELMTYAIGYYLEQGETKRRR
jgi:amidophosphoribosyltransferase